ncbi:MAG TPA: glycosyltransferase family 2 protein [Stellaceae bacterium]|nr:glycosyltransferase family 2 protein [Stellaceae bacterium]
MTFERPALSIVIPVFNGAASIGELVSALEALDVPGGHEIVLVNDGSPDDSLAVCRRLVARAQVPITLVNLTQNYGEHNAVMAGLRVARGQWIITMDDDLQNPPNEVVRLLRHAQESGHDVVYTRYARKRHNSWRNLASRLSNRAADVLLHKPKGLYLSTFRCMTHFMAQAIVDYEGPFPYVDGLIMQVTQNIGALEVEHLPRMAGRSNYTVRRLVRLWLNLFVNFSVMPLRISTLTGFALSFAGIVAFAAVIIETMIHATPAGWASLAASVFLLSGVQLVMLGLIGEYLGKLFLTVNRKPQAVVRDIERSAGYAVEPARGALVTPRH